MEIRKEDAAVVILSEVKDLGASHFGERTDDDS